MLLVPGVLAFLQGVQAFLGLGKQIECGRGVLIAVKFIEPQRKSHRLLVHLDVGKKRRAGFGELCRFQVGLKFRKSSLHLLSLRLWKIDARRRKAARDGLPILSANEGDEQ